MKATRVLIADDHPVFRFGLQMLIQVEPGMDVVGEATTGAEAIEMAEKLEPDVILMDINMPAINGIEATRRILERRPETGILIITMFDDETLFAAVRAGARGYVLKGADGDETLRAIRAVANGEAIFSPAVAERLNRFFSGMPSTPDRPFPELTPREAEILELIAQGYTNNAIAEQLVISPKTVRNQVSSIFSKMQVADRAQAIIKARDAGLGLSD